jgi:tryptophan synthase beta chain
MTDDATHDPYAGCWGQFGGQFMPETLMTAVQQLDVAFREAWADPAFREELNFYLKDFVGRPSPLFFAENLTSLWGGAQVYLKREDLNHTGAHKINNTLGQVLLARRMGKTRLIAETGAGQHGVATATTAAIFGLECHVFMGDEDIRRQLENVKRMRMLGANVVPVHTGTRTLKDAINECLRDWVATVDNTFYVMGTVAGPHPYPVMVREFQRVIGEETKVQMREMIGRLPDTVIACIGGGSNAMGMFAPFVADTEVALIGVEAGGHGVDTDAHAASITGGSVGVLHGSRSYILQDKAGQIQNAHSISAGLDYPGVGPEHAHLHDSNRVQYVSVTDAEAVAAFLNVTRVQGIIPALESSHALAHAAKIAGDLSPDHVLVINLSGRGDKDLASVNEFLDDHPELADEEGN